MPCPSLPNSKRALHRNRRPNRGTQHAPVPPSQQPHALHAPGSSPPPQSRRDSAAESSTLCACFCKTALEYAVSRGDLSLVNSRLSASTLYVNTCNINGWTFLDTALRDKNRDLIQLLLAHKVDIAAQRPSYYTTPLALAVLFRTTATIPPTTLLQAEERGQPSPTFYEGIQIDYHNVPAPGSTYQGIQLL
jgi:ankyrin repeat protein